MKLRKFLVESILCTGTVQQRQIWGRKALGFGWATFGWASCVIVQQSSSFGSCPTFPPLIPTISDLWINDLVSSPVWWEAVTNIVIFRVGIMNLKLWFGRYRKIFEKDYVMKQIFEKVREKHSAYKKSICIGREWRKEEIGRGKKERRKKGSEKKK